MQGAGNGTRDRLSFVAGKDASVDKTYAIMKAAGESVGKSLPGCAIAPRSGCLHNGL